MNGGSLAQPSIAGAIIALGGLVSWWRPAWAPAALLILYPVRLPNDAVAEIPTLFLAGAALPRVKEVVSFALASPLLVCAMIALPVWMVASTSWATAPWFAMSEAAKWCVPVITLILVVAAEAELDAELIVAAAFIGMVPMALWGIAEHLHLIAPIGDPEELRRRLLIVNQTVRGKALFWHPNRLAEFLEQVGLLLAGCAVLGPLRVLSVLGVIVALAGSVATGSTAGMAAAFGGACLVIAWSYGEARPRGRWAILAGAGLLALIGAAVAYTAHGGLASRSVIYRFTLQVIRSHPLLGIGAGNWPLAVAAAPLEVSRPWFQGHSHALALQLWVEVGLVGLLLAFSYFGVPLWRGWRLRATTPPAWRGVRNGAIAGVIALLAHNTVHYFLKSPADGILVGLLLGLAISRYPLQEDAAFADRGMRRSHGHRFGLESRW